MQHKDNMIESLDKLIRFQSTNEVLLPGKLYGKETYEALDYVLDLCDSFGFRTRKFEKHGGFAEIGTGDEMMGILVHLDVVPAGDLENWNTNPYEATEINGKLFGRGVIDDKGPTIGVIYAMKDLLDSGIELNKRVRIIFGMSEENGDWSDIEYYKSVEEHPTFGFTPDADFPVVFGEKGIAEIEISMDKKEAEILSIKGGVAINMVPEKTEINLKDVDGTTITVLEIGESAHASMPWNGKNSIAMAMDNVMNLIDKGVVKCRFAEFYSTLFGHDYSGKLLDAYFSDEQSGEITYNTGIIKNEDNNVKLLIDIRYPVTYKIEEVYTRIKDKITEYKEKYNIESLETKLIFNDSPIYSDKNSALVTNLMSAYKTVTNDETEAIVMGGGTYARTMSNIVAFGPSFPGRELTEHQANEYIYVEDLYKGREIYALAIKNTCSV